MYEHRFLCTHSCFDLKSLLSVTVIDVDDPDLKATTVMPPTRVLEQSVQRKRQRPPTESTEAVADRNHKKVKVKVHPSTNLWQMPFLPLFHCVLQSTLNGEAHPLPHSKKVP